MQLKVSPFFHHFVKEVPSISMSALFWILLVKPFKVLALAFLLAVLNS